MLKIVLGGKNILLHLPTLMSHGVMVTLRFLVPSFKVRILVGQQKSSAIAELFCFDKIWARS